MRSLLKQTLYSFSVNKFNASKDYYKVLGISSTSNQKQIKKSFRQLAKKYHPDSSTGNQQKFKQVNQAYQVLSDTDVKKQYDMARTASSSSAGNYGGYSGSSYGGYQNPYNSGYSNRQSGYAKDYYQQQSSNYRGYTRADGWQNQKYRQQMMNQIFKEYQKQMNNQSYQQSQYQQAQRNRSQYGSFQDMYKNHQENIRQYTAQMKKRQQEIRKAQEAEQYRRQKQFRQYQEQQVREFQKAFNKKVNDLKDGIVNNVHGFVKVGNFFKDTFKNISDAVQNLKKGDQKNKNNNKKK